MLEVTVNDVHKLALSYIDEVAPNYDVESYTIGWINQLLAESLIYENNLREHFKTKQLEEPPLMKEMIDVIPYDWRITRNCLPNGLASLYFLNDDDKYLHNIYRDRWTNGLQEISIAVVHPIQNDYDGGGDTW